MPVTCLNLQVRISSNMQTLSLISVNIIESTAMAAKVMISAIYTERSGSSRYFSVFFSSIMKV